MLLQFFLSRLNFCGRHNHVKEHFRVWGGQARLFLRGHLLYLILQIDQVKTGEVECLRDVLNLLLCLGLADLSCTNDLNWTRGLSQEIVMNSLQKVYN